MEWVPGLAIPVKKLFLQISQNSQKNTCARVSFLKKLQASACNFIKSAPGIGVLLRILLNVSEHFFS